MEPVNPPERPADAQELARALAVEAGAGERVIVAIAGEPGAGKSTLVANLAASLALLGVEAAILPMDGYHLSNAVLEALGWRGRKGAIDTFDADGYVSLLRRVRAGGPRTIFAPSFDHGAGEPLAGSIPIEPGAAVVLTEGNYLLDPSEPWSDVRGLVDHAWFVRTDDAVRRERLVARHVAAGKEPDFAAYWAAEVDEPNAERIRAAAGRAELVLRVP